ncbi:MAG: tetratricopeptide repeat protein [Bacteroidetes bacterium]|nr:tetratricopeptide repeat protein [Bacteroidota bacterium]
MSCATKKSTTTPAQTNTTHTRTDSEFKLHSLFYDACKEKIKGNTDIAMNLLSECLKINPNDAPSNYEIAQMYRYTGNHEQALKHAKAAALSDTKNEWYNLLYIECLHNKRLYGEAAARYELLVKQYPYKRDYYQGLAGEYIYAKDFNKAVQVYSKMQQVMGFDEEVAMQKIKIYSQQKKWSEAEKELKYLIGKNPNESRYYTMLADLYQQQGQPQKALETYKNVLKADSLNPYVHLAMADYYRQQRQDENFYLELRKAFESDDLDIDNKVKILLSYYSVTDNQETTSESGKKLLQQAYELCRSLIKQYPDNPKAHSIYADFLFRDHKYNEAGVELKKVLLYDNSKYAAWNQLLICQTNLRAYDSLLKYSNQAIELFPEQPVPYYLNGIAYMQLKQYQKAEQALKAGKQFVYDTENLPLSVEFALNLGEVYNTLKEYEKSDEEFDHALALDPDNAGALNNYAYYLSLRKEHLEKAEKMSKRSLELTPNNVNYLDTYGWILYQEKKYEEAKQYLEKAFENGGTNRPVIVEHYGDVLYQLRDSEGALDYWKKAKELGAKSDLLDKKISATEEYEKEK